MRLILTADDLGLAKEVNEGIERAHRDGALTAASLMVGERGFEEGVRVARANPGLAVGLHLTLTDGVPVLPAGRIPSLTAKNGRFRDDMAALGLLLALSREARAELAAEVAAQVERFVATGLRPDHVNAHKHFHLHPTIASAVLRIGRRYGMRAVRAPVEDRRVLNQVEPTPPGGRIENVTARLLRRRLRRAGLVVPDRVFGLAWTGALLITVGVLLLNVISRMSLAAVKRGQG